MPKRLFKRYLPDHHKIRDHKHLKCFGKWLHDPNLWHLNRRSVAGGFSVGLFMAFIPLPFQMFFAAAAAIPLRVNLPIAAALVWITNPLTMPPIFFTAYKLGSWVLHTPPLALDFNVSMDWVKANLDIVWQPFLLGSLLLSVLSAIAGYIIVRTFWRIQVLRYLRKRRLRKAKKGLIDH